MLNDIGNDKTIGPLIKEGFDSVFLDVGSELDVKMKYTPGMDLSGIYEAADFLIRANAELNRLSDNMLEPLEIGRRAVVIGYADTTFDCLRTALRLGSEDVTCVCQHSEDEIPAEGKGHKMVRVEGAKYRFLTQPVRFIAGADGRLAAVECVELKLGEPDAKGRRKSVPVDGSNFSIAADTVILSKSAPGIGKYIKNKTNDTTLHEGIFTGGHFVAGSNRAVSAIKGEGKTALALDKNLKSKK